MRRVLRRMARLGCIGWRHLPTMPHSTFGYPFEWKVLGYAQGLSEGRAGSIFAPFLLRLDARGSIERIDFEAPEEGWPSRGMRLAASQAAHLLYDPFDAPGHIWLAWQGIDRPAMERLLGERFDDSDFALADGATSRFRPLKASSAFPSAWAVMF